MKDKYIEKVLRHGSSWVGHGSFAMKLVETYNPKVVVDLGVDYGYSTFCFAYPKIGEVYGVDWFQGDIHAGHRNTYDLVIEMYHEIKEEYGINNVEFIKGDFNDVAKTWNKKIDILHVDGLHTYEGVKSDITNYLPLINKGGVIGGHDYVQGWLGVINAVDEIIGKPDKTFKDGSWIKYI